MDNTPNLAAALAKVQSGLPKLERDRTVEVQQKNGGTYSYSYVTLANLSDAILPLLATHGLSFTAMPGAGSDGKMCVRYHLMHASGESLTGEFPISGEGGIQMIGGRITYARRYCLAAVVGVAADEDDESRLNDDGPRTAQRAPARPRTQRPAPAPQETAPTTQRAATRPARGAAPPPLPGDAPGEPPAEAMTERQKRALMATYQARGGTREDRLAHAREVLGRDIGTFTDLTREDAGRLLEALDALDVEPADDTEGGA